jgi:hypothetical protein
MDAARFKELQDDEQREDSPDSGVRAVVENELVDVHTSTPGIIKSFDASKQTAVVQPAIRRLFIGKGFINLPQCVDVPVQFPRGGNFVITFPVASGDECLLTFGERAIDFWWDRGGVQEPAEPRMHDLSDAFAHLGFSSRGRVPGSISTDALEIRTLDGATVLRLDPDGSIYIGAKAGAQPIPLGDALHAILAAIKTHTHAVSGAVAAASVELAAPILNWDVRSSKGKVK